LWVTALEIARWNHVLEVQHKRTVEVCHVVKRRIIVDGPRVLIRRFPSQLVNQAGLCAGNATTRRGIDENRAFARKQRRLDAESISCWLVGALAREAARRHRGWVPTGSRMHLPMRNRCNCSGSAIEPLIPNCTRLTKVCINRDHRRRVGLILVRIYSEPLVIPGETSADRRLSRVGRTQFGVRR